MFTKNIQSSFSQMHVSKQMKRLLHKPMRSVYKIEQILNLTLMINISPVDQSYKISSEIKSKKNMS